MRHCFIVVAIASLCAAPSAQAQGLAPTGTLRASFIASNPVQGRVDAKSGAVTGPVADLTRELARRLGVPFVIAPLPDAGTVLESVKAGRADIGFLAYEAARATQVDFSQPYSLAASAYAVRADSPIRTTAEVDRPGVTIGAVKGVSQEIFVSATVKNARVRVLPDTPSADAMTKMFASKEIDAFAANRTRMEELARLSPQVRVLPDNFQTIGQAVVVQKGNSAGLAELSRFLDDVLSSGFVKSSIDRAGVAGVDAAPAKR
jgi:polar amino acid transport system substrate-binding protein